MSPSLAIALNVVLAVALLAGLAHTMSHPRKLTPHRSEADSGQIEAGREYEQYERIAA
jgi:hypothetical protein